MRQNQKDLRLKLGLRCENLVVNFVRCRWRVRDVCGGREDHVGGSVERTRLLMH